MIVTNRIPYSPVFISYQESHFYLEVNYQSCVLHSVEDARPLYQLNEPILMAQGTAGNAQTVHLAILKANGELNYTVVSRSGTHQTTVLTKLDVRSTKYRRLILLPRGELVHIFYAYSHQAIPDLWYIEHRLWNGKAWQSVRLGEVVHPRYPLYHVALDSQNNIHFLALTFQGRQSILLENRFHGTFHLWGNPIQALTLQHEVLDMASILTPDNTHHIFWVAKTPGGKYEIHWARRLDAHNISGSWVSAPAPIHTAEGPWQSCGALELNGTLWLLAKGEQEYLLFNDGSSWRLASTRPATHRPLEYVRRDDKSFYHASWLLEDSSVKIPLFHQELGLNLTWPAMNQQRSAAPASLPHPVPVTVPPQQAVTLYPGMPSPGLNQPGPTLMPPNNFGGQMPQLQSVAALTAPDSVQGNAGIMETAQPKAQTPSQIGTVASVPPDLALPSAAQAATATEPLSDTPPASDSELVQLKLNIGTSVAKASSGGFRRSRISQKDTSRRMTKGLELLAESQSRTEDTLTKIQEQLQGLESTVAAQVQDIQSAIREKVQETRQATGTEIEEIRRAADAGIEEIRRVLQEELQTFRLETSQQIQDIRLDTRKRIEEIRIMTQDAQQVMACQMADLSPTHPQMQVANAQMPVANSREKGFWSRWFR